MRRKSYADMNCSVARALDIVGDPWTLLIVRDVFWGHHRFNDFLERLGIARNTLSDRLATLVDAGVLDKVAYQENPERFEYRLTEKGRALRPVIITLMQWGDAWSGIGEPPVRLIDRSTGCPIEPALVDALSGRRIDEINVQAVGAPVPDRRPGTER
jgi:DNA-binding HxlR family transcriptional regulator